jgi:hypothetical protein
MLGMVGTVWRAGQLWDNRLVIASLTGPAPRIVSDREGTKTQIVELCRGKAK